MDDPCMAILCYYGRATRFFFLSTQRFVASVYTVVGFKFSTHENIVCFGLTVLTLQVFWDTPFSFCFNTRLIKDRNRYVYLWLTTLFHYQR